MKHSTLDQLRLAWLSDVTVSRVSKFCPFRTWHLARFPGLSRSLLQRQGIQKTCSPWYPSYSAAVSGAACRRTTRCACFFPGFCWMSVSTVSEQLQVAVCLQRRRHVHHVTLCATIRGFHGLLSMDLTVFGGFFAPPTTHSKTSNSLSALTVFVAKHASLTRRSHQHVQVLVVQERFNNLTLARSLTTTIPSNKFVN